MTLVNDTHITYLPITYGSAEEPAPWAKVSRAQNSSTKSQRESAHVASFKSSDLYRAYRLDPRAGLPQSRERVMSRFLQRSGRPPRSLSGRWRHWQGDAFTTFTCPAMSVTANATIGKPCTFKRHPRPEFRPPELWGGTFFEQVPVVARKPQNTLMRVWAIFA
jgi:hypothetical protein